MRAIPAVLIVVGIAGATLAACRRDATPPAPPTAPSSAPPTAAAQTSTNDGSSPVAIAPPDFDSGFAVRIGSISARAQIRNAGLALTGYYRYPTSKTDLLLAGYSDKTGNLSLVERTSSGVITGRWLGVFTGPASAAGTWSSADGKRQLPFTLEAAPPLAPLAGVPDSGAGTSGVDEVAFDVVTREDPAGAGCTNGASFPRVSGLVPATRNALVNGFIQTLVRQRESVKCDGTEPNLPWSSGITIGVDAQAPGFVALSVSHEQYAGGAHPLSGSRCVLLDTRTGKATSLLDVLGAEATARLRSQIASEVHKYWADNSVDPDYLGEGGSIPLDDDVVCYVGPRKLLVQFSPYAVAPYVYGYVRLDVDTGPLLPLVPPSKARDALFGARGD